MGNRDLSIVDAQLAAEDCRLPLIVPFLCIVRQRCIVASATISTISNRSCMYLHLITNIDRKVMLYVYTYEVIAEVC